MSRSSEVEPSGVGDEARGGPFLFILVCLPLSEGTQSAWNILAPCFDSLGHTRTLPLHGHSFNLHEMI